MPSVRQNSFIVQEDDVEFTPPTKRLDRDKRVIALLLKNGLTSQSIADVYSVGERTVERWRRNNKMRRCDGVG